MTEIDPAKRARPLSPHLQVYKLPLTANMSIMHRFTGIALSAGSLLVVTLLMAAAYGEEAYNTVMRFMAGPIGLLMLFGWSAALCYHMCNGIRHLIWDTGRLFKKSNARASGFVVLICAVLLLAAIWCAAYSAKVQTLSPVDRATLASQMQEETEVLR